MRAMSYTGNLSELEKESCFFVKTLSSVFSLLDVTAKEITDVDSDTSHLSLAPLKNGASIRIPTHRSVVTRKCPSKRGGGGAIRKWM